MKQARLRKVRRIVLSALVALAATAVAVGFAYAGSGEAIPGGVRVAGVPVGGMDADDAVRTLQAQSRRNADEPVTFVAAGRSFSFTPRQLGVTVDWRAAVEVARAEGSGFGPLRGFRRLALRASGSEVQPAVGSYDEIVASAVKAVAAKVDQVPVPASITLQGLEPSIVSGRPGRVLDRVASGKAIVAALASFDRRAPVTLPMRTQGVRVTAASLAPVVSTLRTMLSGPVRLQYAGAYVAVTPAQLASMIEVPAPGSRALKIGGPAADRVLDRLSTLVDAPAKDADFTLGADGLPAVVPSVPGRTLDRDATARSIIAAASRPADRTGRLAIAVAQPERTTAEALAMGVDGVVGSYVTTYGGVANRLHNVRLVARLVDDHLIAPGETFSFNRTTGERSAEKGFLEAPVIINGELQNGLGGGVCQVSTTVFNAAFEAGLPITSRTNHALYIGHYPLGRDATVDYPGIDLQFRNDTGKWIWLRAFIGDSSLRITLYGTPPERKVESTTSPLRATGPVPIEKVEDPTLPKGKRVIDPGQTFAPPRATSIRRTVYDKAGTVLYDSVWYSTYRGEAKVVRVGTKPKAKPGKATPGVTSPGVTDPAGTMPASTEPGATAADDTVPPPAAGDVAPAGAGAAATAALQ